MKKRLILVIICTMIFTTANTAKNEPAPADIEKLFDMYTREMVDRNPNFATSLGLSEAMGYPVDNDRWSDDSPEALERFYKSARKYLDWLYAYDKSKLTRSQRRAADILKYSLHEDLAGEPFKYHSYVINPRFGFHNTMTTNMTQYHPMTGENDARDYIARLQGYKKKLAQLSARLKLQEQQGIIPPAVVVDRDEAALESFIAPAPKKNVLYTTFETKLDQLDIDDKKKKALCKEAEKAIKGTVYPAYKKMLSHVRRVMGKAGNDAGAWKLPDGDAYYRYCLKLRTHSNLSPAEVHELGIKEVARIHKEIRKLCAVMGYRNIRARNHAEFISGFYRAVSQQGRGMLFYANSAASQQQVLKDFKDMIADVSRKLPKFFSVLPKTPVTVEPVPEFKERTSGTSYQPAPLDGKRQGIFYINLMRLPFKPGMKTLAVHEAVPGHHFQIALAKESKDLRMFRNFLFFTAYVEGWALYAERLGREHGWFKDRLSQIGSLGSELHRAVRLVTDTGIHYKRWNRQQAYNYMQDNLGWGSFMEIDRYIVWPGQACAYKMGELKILELRKRAQKALKKKFDIKDFHRVVLENGTVPLPLLERYVDEYIEERKK